VPPDEGGGMEISMKGSRVLKKISAWALTAALILGTNVGHISVLAADGSSASGGNATTVSDNDGQSAPQNPGTTAPTTRTKLATPTGLQWEGNWSAVWNGVEGAEGYYEVDIYKDGQQFDYMSWSGLLEENISINIYQMISDSGVYKFRVKANASYDSTSLEDSEWSSFSSERTYVRPSKVLGKTVATWDSEDPQLIHFPNVEGACGYKIILYKVQNGERRQIYSSWSSTSDYRYEGGTDHEWQLGNAILEEGTYYVTVQALSGNIDEVANGPVGDFSAPFETKVNAEKISQNIENAIKNAATASDALDTITATDSIANIATAMQTDTKVLDQVKSLEADYIAEKGITVAKSVSAEASKLVDSSKISMVGAGLNVDGGTVSLDVGVPAKKEVVDTNHYANSVQLDIKLVNDGAEVGTLQMPVTITIPIPQGIDVSRLVILHYSADGTFETLKLRNNSDGTVTFTVTHFSTFVFAEDTTVASSNSSGGKNGGTSNQTTAADANITSPKTGEVLSWTAYALYLISAGSFLAYIVLKKREQDE